MIKQENNSVHQGREEYDFSEEAEHVIHLFKNTKQNLFITGKAGTGKSTLLHFIRQQLEEDVIVLAPTGIAALNVNGDTIHSFFRLKPGFELDEAINAKTNKKTIEKLKAVKTIVIDEISMVRADILDAIDVLLQKVKRNQDHFGGVRMVFFGDLYQLPPTLVEKDFDWFNKKYDSPYFFSAKVFQQKDLFIEAFQLKTIELTKVYRQKEQVFIDVLNAIRVGEVSQETLDFINARVGPNFKPLKEQSYIHLVTTNYMADTINNQKLNEIEHPFIQYTASSQGKIGNIQPNGVHISVKIGAQVMFVNNDANKRWVNGTIGKVVDYSEVYKPENDEFEQVLTVLLENGKKVRVKPYTWEISQYVFKGGSFRRENLGHFTQIPLKLAWAVTIHKSQGKTFSHVILDVGYGSFAHGQTYVALSRCKTFKGLVLKRKIEEKDIIVDEKINTFISCY